MSSGRRQPDSPPKNVRTIQSRSIIITQPALPPPPANSFTSTVNLRATRWLNIMATRLTGEPVGTTGHSAAVTSLITDSQHRPGQVPVWPSEIMWPHEIYE